MIRFDSAQFYPGKIMFSQFAGFGIQAQNIPATGGNGPSIFYEDAIELNAAPTDEFMAELLTVPAAGNFHLYEDGSFEFTGAPDGIYYATYRGRINGVEYGVFTITLIVGNVAQNIVASPVQQLTESVSFSVSQNQLVSVSAIQQLNQVNPTLLSVSQLLSVPTVQQLTHLAPVFIGQNTDSGTVQPIVVIPVEQTTQATPVSVSVSQSVSAPAIQQLTQSVRAAIYSTQNINVSAVQQFTHAVLVTEQVPEPINTFYIKLTVLPSPFTLSR